MYMVVIDIKTCLAADLFIDNKHFIYEHKKTSCRFFIMMKIMNKILLDNTIASKWKGRRKSNLPSPSPFHGR